MQSALDGSAAARFSEHVLLPYVRTVSPVELAVEVFRAVSHTKSGLLW